MRIAALVVALAVCVHAAFWALGREEASAPDHPGQLSSVSYAPYQRSQNPERGDQATAAQIREDLRVLAEHTRAIRTYASTQGGELIPAIADEFGLKVTIGVWIDNDEERNEREIRTALELARQHRNVIGIVVANETIYRGEKTVPELVQIIQRVKRETNVPVTTGEIWSVYVDYPELASAVDYIAAHILPYWEGYAAEQTVDLTIEFYNRLRRVHPGKRIVIAEFGWPSAGYNRRDAFPGAITQAQVLRDFVVRADALGIDYNIIEAIDQPWKTNEGSVGPYWGFLDAWRDAKFSWTGTITNPDHWKIASIALMVGFLLSLPILVMTGVTLGQAVLLTAASHAVGAWFATVFAYWIGHYFVPGAAFALGIGLLLLIPLVFIAMARISEIAAVAFGRRERRLLDRPAELGSYVPKVSIHVPAYREPPEMLKQTLDALAQLNYPNWEAVIVINNTPDAAFWAPIEEHCRLLGDRFKFINAEKVEGFKAGALRLALEHTAADAEVIGVIDADYAVHPDWLRDLVPAFAHPQVGLVQAPQEHRDGSRSVMHHAMNGEYAGFFDIGMVERNEVNAVVVHGTMCLIRRSALEAAGNWPADTICEDTDLGLTILEKGWLAHYTNRRYGHGLLPDSFEDYKKQRHRWAYGGFGIIKKHWRRFLPGRSQLSHEQRREYALGWLTWLGAETIGVAVAMLNLIWVPVVAFIGIAVPDKVLTLPIIAAFTVTLLHFATLYRLRVDVSPGQAVASAFAAMSLQLTVAKAMWDGVIKDKLPFIRTAKGGRSVAQMFPAFWEAVLGGLLVAGAVTLYVTNGESVREINIFAAVLVVQSLPFLAAVFMATLERSRFNEFAYWTQLRARMAALRLADLRPNLLRRPQPQPAPAPVVVESSRAIETADTGR